MTTLLTEVQKLLIWFEKPSCHFMDDEFPGSNIAHGKYDDHLSVGPGAKAEEGPGSFGYFVVIAIVCVVMYLVFHNKQKVRKPNLLNTQK